MKKTLLIFAVLLFTLCGTSKAQVYPENYIPAGDIPPTTSRVYPGADGRLVYTVDSLGDRIPDFSNAGYKGGGVLIPLVPVKATIWPVLGDNSATIQAAIDSVSAMPMDASGFRGAVVLRTGTYEIHKPITISASGVVLRGEGMSDIGTILIAKIPKDRQVFGRNGLINITGPTGITVLEETKQNITDKYVPVGANSVNVVSAKAFKAGDRILVRRIGNQAWIKEIGQDSASVGRNRWAPFTITYDRVIREVRGNTLVFDAPIFTSVDERWGGGNVVKYNDARIEQVAIENLRAISEYNPTVRTISYGNMNREDYTAEEYYSDENHVSNLVNFTNVKNGWVRNITALHFVNSVVQVNAGSKWITIQDCETKEPISQRRGSRRFVFHINGQLTLVQRCFSHKGRHSFVLQNSESSGNVFLDCIAVNPYSTSEPHNRWVNGVLYDNVKAPLTARFWDYIIGWAGANIVFWNCEGDFLVQKPPTAQNYTFGHIGVNAVIFNIPLQDPTKTNGHLESLDKHVTPRSLYLTQLNERLGEQAVRNIMKVRQNPEY